MVHSCMRLGSVVEPPFSRILDWQAPREVDGLLGTFDELSTTLSLVDRGPTGDKPAIANPAVRPCKRCRMAGAQEDASALADGMCHHGKMGLTGPGLEAAM